MVAAVQPVFLYQLVEQLTGFEQVSILAMLQHMFTSYGAIDEIDLEENAVKMMETYEPEEPLAQMIKELEKGGEFASAGGQTISNVVMVSKWITLLVQTSTFNEDVI